MTSSKLICLLFALAFFACNEKSALENVPGGFNNERLFIQFDGMWIGVETDKDSVMLYLRENVDTIIDGQSRTRQVSKRISSVMSPTLSDSITASCYRIIRDTANTGGHVTDYAGEYVKIWIQKGTSKYSAELNSVSQWNLCSESYSALYRLLKRNKLIK